MKTVACAVFLFLSSSAFALEWETKHLSVKASPLQRQVELAFGFTNPGGKPVTILSVDSSCDCLEASPSARTIAPGANGTIQARFTVGDRTGIYRRTIVVRTDESADPTPLHVELDVPEIASISPRSVEWKLQDTPAEKTVDIRASEGIDVVISSVQSTSAEFGYRLETVEPGRHYRLHLAPKATGSPVNAAFRLFAKAANTRDLVLSAYANVR